MQSLEQHQPQEQAGFRPGFSTTDHINVLSQLQEKANKYKIPLCFAFVDYEKAFDSIKFTPLFTALANQGVDPAYITILRDPGFSLQHFSMLEPTCYNLHPTYAFICPTCFLLRPDTHKKFEFLESWRFPFWY